MCAKRIKFLMTRLSVCGLGVSCNEMNDILSKRRKDARLILFYKIINNLAQVPHKHILTKAYEGTRKKNNHKFRHIAVNTSQYNCIGSRFSPKLSVRGISCHSLIPLL